VKMEARGLIVGSVVLIRLVCRNRMRRVRRRSGRGSGRGAGFRLRLSRASRSVGRPLLSCSSFSFIWGASSRRSGRTGWRRCPSGVGRILNCRSAWTGRNGPKPEDPSKKSLLLILHRTSPTNRNPSLKGNDGVIGTRFSSLGSHFY